MYEADSTVYTHCDVVDVDGHKVGTVSDVVSDVATLEPKWLVVDIGLLKTGHYLPVDAVERTSDGQLMVPFDKDTIKTAAKPNKGHVLTPEDDKALRRHYGLSVN